MDHADRDELSQWVARSAALLEPPARWEPNQKAARARIAAGLQRRSPLRRLLPIGVAAAVIACLSIGAIPLTRAFAEQPGIGWHALDQFWYWISIGRTQQLIRLGKLPEEVRSIGAHTATSGVGEPGFVPRLPRSGALPDNPRLSASGPASFGTPFRTAELGAALRAARITDQTVPAAWEGVWVGARIGPRITAEWADLPGFESVTLVQSAPPVFAVPPGIDLTSFAALNLRATWMSAETARHFAQYAVPAAALLAVDGTQTGIDEHFAVAAYNVSLRHGPAILIEEWDDLADHGGEQAPLMNRLTLLWGVPDRVYVLRATLKVPLEMASYDLAGAIATVVGWANAIE